MHAMEGSIKEHMQWFCDHQLGLVFRHPILCPVEFMHLDNRLTHEHFHLIARCLKR